MDVFLIEDDDLLEKYNTIWDNASADTKNNLIVSLSTKRTLKTKTQSHDNKVTDFYDNEILWLNSNHTCLAVISLGFCSQER